jgi:hypothetical protein
MESWEVEARVSVQKLMMDYGKSVDTGRLDALALLFTESCHYDMGSEGAVLESRAAIIEHGETVKTMFRENPNFGGRVRHHYTPVSVEFSSPTSAKATSYFLTMGRTGPDHWGMYRDVLVQVDGSWLFERRVVAVEGHSATSPANDQTLTNS